MAYVNQHAISNDSTQWGTFTTRSMKEVTGPVKVYISKDGDNFLGVYMAQPSLPNNELLCGFTTMARASDIPVEVGYMGNLGNGFPIFELTHAQELEYVKSAKYLQFDRKYLKY